MFEQRVLQRLVDTIQEEEVSEEAWTYLMLAQEYLTRLKFLHVKSVN